MSPILPCWAAGASSSSARDTDAVARALQAALSSGPIVEPVKLEPVNVSEQGRVGKIRKRKTRTKSQIQTTTYITTDPTNFQRMVQEVTGMHARKPEMPQLAATTSAAFLSGRAAVAVPGVEGGTRFGRLERLQNCYFPTLESWTVSQM